MKPMTMLATLLVTSACTEPSDVEMSAIIPATSGGELTVTLVIVTEMTEPGERMDLG